MLSRPSQYLNWWWSKLWCDVQMYHLVGKSWPILSWEYDVDSPHKGQWHRALMFSVIFYLNKRLSKQSGCLWFEMPSGSLWHHCNDFTSYIHYMWKPQHRQQNGYSVSRFTIVYSYSIDWSVCKILALLQWIQHGTIITCSIFSKIFTIDTP